MSADLSGLNLLLVRPEQGSHPFVEQVNAAGAVVHHHPVMRIEAITASTELALIQQQIAELAQANKVIFVSRTAAVMGLTQLLRQQSLALSDDLACYAVGKSTAAVLAEQGIRAEVPENNMTSEGLLALPSLNNIKNQKIVIFSGVGGRTRLVEELKSRGAQVSRCEFYRRVRCDNAAMEITKKLKTHQMTAVAIHSGELLDNLIQILDADTRSILLKLPAVVSSERVAELAKTAGFCTVSTALSAMPKDMVSALRGWYSKA